MVVATPVVPCGIPSETQDEAVAGAGTTARGVAEPPKKVVTGAEAARDDEDP